MTARERVRRTLTFEHPDRVPRDLWMLPRVPEVRGDEVAALLRKYPMDLAEAPLAYGPSGRCRGTPRQVGTYIDDWGCEFTVLEAGVIGEVKRPPLADWSRLDGWSPPWELLDGFNFAQVEAACASTDLFIRAGTHIRPFERLQFLRGTENLFTDLLTRPSELDQLRDLIHAFNLRDIETWSKTSVDAVFFMDDWGSQKGLLIAPEIWRSYFKPLYQEYCDLIKASGKFVFFHSDGHIFEIYPDLIEVGVDALNSQLFCMDIEEIGRRHRGQVTFWGELSRQYSLPFGGAADVRAAVRRMRRAIADPAGGVIAQCEWGIDDPAANIETVYETWLEESIV